MKNTNDRWSALSMKDRAALIDIYVKSGITDLGEIRKDYNSFGDGGGVNGGELEPSVVTDYTSLKEEAKNARDWVFDYYKSDGYKSRALAGGISKRNPMVKHFGLFPKKKMDFLEDYSVDSSYKWLYPVIGLKPSEGYIKGDHNDTVGWVTAHEFAHYNKMYNSAPKRNEIAFNSPYYGYYYGNIPQNFLDALAVHKYADLHDSEYNESYSDLIGLRYLLDKHGIFNSKNANAVFDESLYDKVLEDERFKKNRFLKLHNKKQVINAINDVAQNTTNKNRLDYINLDNIAAKGGKLNKFATGGPTENNWEIPFSLEPTTVPITKYDYYTLAPEAVQIPIRDLKQKYAMAPELIALDEAAQITELKERAAKEYSFGVLSDVLNDIGNQERVNKRMLTNIYHNNQPDDFKYINSSEVDTSPKIKITAPNTDISKFIYGNNISEEAIKEIKQVASKRGLDPYDILAHMLIESSGEFNGITRNSYFNTHDVLERQISPRLLDPNNSRNIETLLRNLGVYNESRQYTNEEIRDYILDYDKQLQEAVSNLEYPSSTIDAVGLRISKFGRDFNPAQKGFKSSKGEIKNSYLDMINSAITSLKENMPDLFK